jgi:hypothetical protein
MEAGESNPETFLRARSDGRGITRAALEIARAEQPTK